MEGASLGCVVVGRLDMAEREERSDPKEPSSAKAEGAKADDEVQKDPEATKAEAEEDDDEECGFCKFMKAGPCGEVFEVRAIDDRNARWNIDSIRNEKELTHTFSRIQSIVSQRHGRPV